jgi:hypothetical protein
MISFLTIMEEGVDMSRIKSTKLATNEHVLYHAITNGFANIWAVTDKILDIDEKVVLWGRRSDFYISFPPDHSWDRAIEVMRGMIDRFDPETYTPKNLIETHWDEEIKWVNGELAVKTGIFKVGRSTCN